MKMNSSQISSKNDFELERIHLKEIVRLLAETHDYRFKRIMEIREKEGFLSTKAL
jgi:hypothetical protein